jgi:hypothetical protein
MALNNVPLAGQSLGVTRNPINTNFNTINADFLVDHVEYVTGGAGKHNKVTFPVQAAAPGFLGGEEGLYNLLYATTTKNELFVHKQINAGTTDIPFTASKMSNNTFPASENGWSYLPSGLLVKWGSMAPAAVNVNGVFAVTVNALSGGPLFQQVFQVMVTPFDDFGGVNVGSNFYCSVSGGINNNTGDFLAKTVNRTANSFVVYYVIGV